MDNAQGQNFRVFCRCKSQEWRNVSAGTSGQSLRGSCFSPDGETFDPGVFPGTFWNYRFQNRPYCPWSFFGHDPRFHRILQRPHLCSVRTFHTDSKMGRDPVSAIDDRTDCCCQLDRRNLKRLAKRYSGKLHLPHIFRVMHDRSRFSRKINSCFFQKPELFEIFIIILYSQPQPHFNKHRVAGVLSSLHKVLCTMSGPLCTVYPPVLHHFIPRAEKTVFRWHNSFFQSRCHGDNLKSRTWFISIVQTGISPHLVQKILLLFSIWRRFFCV